MHDNFFENIPILLWNALGHPGGQLALQIYLSQQVKDLGPDSKELSAFGEAVGHLMTEPEPPVSRMEKLLNDLMITPPPPGVAEPDAAPCAAVMAYWWVAQVRPDWLPDEVGKLQAASADPREAVRSLAEAALEDLGAN